MRCNSCGHVNNSSGAVCAQCGDSLSAREASADQRPAAVGAELARERAEGAGYRTTVSGSAQGAAPVAERRGRSGPAQPATAVAGAGALPSVVQGQVSGFQQHVESGPSGVQIRVWTFRLDVYDSRGLLIERYAVEMRDALLRGVIRDGDMVEVDTSKWRDDVLTPTTVRNLTTESVAGVNGKLRLGRRVVTGLILLFIGFVVFNIFTGFRDAARMERYVQAKARCFDERARVEALTSQIRFRKESAQTAPAFASELRSALRTQVAQAERELQEASTALTACERRR